MEDKILDLVDKVIALHTPAKIALYGPKGTGKSTFINAVITAFEMYWGTVPEYKGKITTLKRVDTSDASKHITTACQEIPLCPSFCPLQLVIVDVWGDEAKVSEKFNRIEIFEAVLNGWMKDATINDIEATENKDGFKKKYFHDKPSEQNRISCVIFVDSTSTSTTGERICQYKEKTNEAGIQSCLVHTMIDRKCPKVKTNPKMIQETQDYLVDGKPTEIGNLDAALVKLLEEKSNDSGFSHQDIFPLMNPCKETSNNNPSLQNYLVYKVIAM
jgi:hypothetical protein